MVRTRVEDPAFDCQDWATELSRVTPEIEFAEDGEYAHYRNIMEDETFPFDLILRCLEGALTEYFIDSVDEIRLDDAFAIHYNTSHYDTRVGRHMDPSDITVNLCLERSDDLAGSQVLFHGHQRLPKSPNGLPSPPQHATDKFLVGATAGWATIHFGFHPHEVTRLVAGRRTNIVLTYCFKDPGKSEYMNRTETCYCTTASDPPSGAECVD